MRTNIIRALIIAMAAFSCTACGSAKKDSNNNLESGISAIQKASEVKKDSDSMDKNENKTDDLREGTSSQTVATPKDFPKDYDYGSGQITGWSREEMLKKMPAPRENETVLNTKPDSEKIQALYLWEEGKAPAKTKFTKDMTGYFDEWDFRPYVTAIPVKSGVKDYAAWLQNIFNS